MNPEYKPAHITERPIFRVVCDEHGEVVDGVTFYKAEDVAEKHREDFSCRLGIHIYSKPESISGQNFESQFPND